VTHKTGKISSFSQFFDKLGLRKLHACKIRLIEVLDSLDNKPIIKRKILR
jgi:hypothetical protein